MAAIAVIPATQAQETDPPSHYYMYFDQVKPLGLDNTQVALQVATKGEAALPAEPLPRLGLDPATLRPMASPGWALVDVPVSSRSGETLETLIASLAGVEEIGFVSPVFLDSRGQPWIVTQHIHVGFHQDRPAKLAQTILDQRIDGVIEEEDFAGLPGVYRLRMAAKNGFTVLAAANALTALPEVRFAEPDAIVRAEIAYIPNDPLFPQQWALSQANDADMGAPEAWDLTTGDDSIVAVIMGSGIQQNHPDIHQIPGQDFTGHGTPGGGPYNQCDQHATTVAGCISAVIDNGTDVVGVAPDCVVASAKIGTGIWLLICMPFMESQPSYVANALSWSVSIGARVTNSSFSYEASATLTTAYANARANGVVNFAATGNDGTGSISYPASLSTVVAVGALNSSGARASFSQYGTGIGFSAPGEGILTTDQTGSDGYENGDYVTADGTSYASPYGAGVAALTLSRAPGLSPAALEQVLSDTCVDLGSPGYDTVYGWGFVNAYNAAAASAPRCPATFTATAMWTSMTATSSSIASPVPEEVLFRRSANRATLTVTATSIAMIGNTSYLPGPARRPTHPHSSLQANYPARPVTTVRTTTAMAIVTAMTRIALFRMPMCFPSPRATGRWR